jgi:hypothetical protein
MKRSDYIDMRKQLAQEYEDKLAALDKVFAMFGGTPVGEKLAPTGASSNGSGWSHDISKRDAVRGTVQHLAGQTFTLKDVKAALVIHFAHLAPEIEDNTLSAILSKLAEKGELSIVKKKIGKSPARYSLPGETHQL